jgi:hypothetical protein
MIPQILRATVVPLHSAKVNHRDGQEIGRSALGRDARGGPGGNFLNIQRCCELRTPWGVPGPLQRTDLPPVWVHFRPSWIDQAVIWITAIREKWVANQVGTQCCFCVLLA